MNRPQLLILLAFALLFAACSSSRDAAGPDLVAKQLDTLSARSAGDYLHVRIGQCDGMCEAFVSIYRESAAKRYIYEAEGWIYDELDRDFVLYRIRRPIDITTANNLLGRAKQAGLLKLGAEESTKSSRKSGTTPVWVHARIGTDSVATNRAYVPGAAPPSVGPPTPGIGELREVLLAPLFSAQIK
jgi:hypothetical protein